MLRNFLLHIVYYISKLFPKKKHPFNIEKNGVLNLNYSDHEYKQAPEVIKLFEKSFDFKKLKWKKILDIWCWWWGFWVYLAQNYDCIVYWIDLQKDFIKQANNIAIEKKQEKKCFFSLQDALNMDFSYEEFDFVFATDVVEHIQDVWKLFDEVYRVLKKWGQFFVSFAPYYEIFWHHLWDTLPVPWLHVIFSDSFLIDLYKLSCKNLPDWQKRINLRIWLDENWKEVFSYLNKITRKKFDSIVYNFVKDNKFIIKYQKQYFLKNLNFFSRIPFLSEMFFRLNVSIFQKY